MFKWKDFRVVKESGEEEIVRLIYRIYDKTYFSRQLKLYIPEMKTFSEVKSCQTF